ncbi:MAG: AbrB/MazE/SpoVT family DNA-binding domain-containing protein [Patescibacteria group bacterium]
MLYQSKVTRKGQATIPVKLRQKLGLKVGQYFNYSLDPKTNTIEIKPIPDFSELRGIFKTNIKWNKKLAQKAFEEGMVNDYIAKQKRIDGYR